jgi:flavin-dependent dehydrogenase
MVQRSTYDVAIVGGGIAGCTAATLFGRAGRRVALIESRPDISSYKRLCTTQILACANATIERLGLDRSIEAEGGIRSGFHLWTRWGWLRDPREGSGEEAHHWSIRRQKLDPMLRELARSTPGVDLLLGRRAVGLLAPGGRVRGVVVEDPEGGSAEITARLVVGADGRHSPVAGLAGVGARRWRRHERFGYAGYYRNVSLTSGGKAQFWILDPDIAYAFPMDDGVTLLACGLTKKGKLAGFKTDIEGNLIRFLRNLPDAPSFDPADRIGKILGITEYPTVWRRRPPPGLALIGDAAVTADWVWGVGCGWAFQSGEWLADAAADALESVTALDAAIGRYRRRLRSEILDHFLMICDYQAGRPLNPLEKLAFSAGVKDPRTAERLTRFGYRLAPVRKILTPAAVGRAVWVNLTRRGARTAPQPGTEEAVG